MENKSLNIKVQMFPLKTFWFIQHIKTYETL